MNSSLKDTRLADLKLRAQKLNKSIKKGKKPVIEEIVTIVKQVRKEIVLGRKTHIK